MADAAPVCDVLREAMEYLSKLGSNLRVRSESLKEKRLRKEKLRNVHAVQKAAGKVLLICELSKKSIENVEVGVKNILTQIDASQSSLVADSSRRSIEKSDLSKSVKYEYFQYGSRKLKIRDKVNIKHYTSVKVLAKPMSTFLQDKYPIYYDCKLYRLRRKKLKATEELGSDDVDNINSKNDITFKENKEDHTSTEDKKSSDECVAHVSKRVKFSNSESDERPEISHTGGSNKIIDKSSQKDNANNKSPVGKERKKFKHIKVVDSSDSDTGTNANTEVSKEKANSNLDVEESQKNCNGINKDDSNRNDIEGDKNLGETEGNVSATNETSNVNNEGDMSIDTQDIHTEVESVKSALLNEVDADVRSDNVNDSSQTVGLNDIAIGEKNVEEDNISNNENETTVEYRTKSKSNSKVCSEETNAEKESVCTEEINENINNTTKEDDQDKVGEGKTDATASHDKISKPNLENENSQSSTDSRPFIKCVNINKLLKEDKLPKMSVSLIEIDDSDSDNDFKKSKHKEKSKLSISKTQLKKIKRNSLCIDGDTKKTEDEEYWKQKRKEVELFKPKKFTVNVAQLPKLTTKYLHKNQLKRITKNGTVVCEVSIEKDKVSLSEDNHKELNESTEDENVKRALLYESDTDNDDRSKNALLNESDSDSHPNDFCSSKDRENKSDNENTRSRKNSGSKSKSRSNTPSSANKLEDRSLDTNKIKSSLLNESTDDSKTPTKKRKYLSDESTPPPSKRKHIMESMHAKKMLLTYSSSSDTEDEQLRNALKEIRDTLLKDNAGDDNNHQNEKESVNTFDQCDMAPSEKDNGDSELGNDTSAKDTNSLGDDNTEEKSNTCSEKVRRQ